MKVIDDEHDQKPKRGRPRRIGADRWFGMKISKADREMIKTLAAMEGKPASRVVLDLIYNALNYRTGQLTPKQLRALPEDQRFRILDSQAKRAEAFYGTAEKPEPAQKQRGALRDLKSAPSPQGTSSPPSGPKV